MPNTLSSSTLPPSLPEEFRCYKQEFVTRVYYMRIMGAMLCVPPIVSVLLEQGRMSGWIWAALALNGLIWPHLACMWSRRSSQPSQREFNNLIIDSALCGFWIATMSVSLAPTAIFVAILTADKVAAGGWGLLSKTSAALAGGFLLTWWLLGFPFDPNVSRRTMLSCIPFLFFYSVGLSYLMYRLGKRVVAQNRELQRLSRMDPSLGISNRRYFEACANTVLERVHQGRQEASLLLVDVDRFKGINDQYGHGIGDAVLQQLTSILADEIRDIDLSARYGGDEFAVLLVNTNARHAGRIGERIRQRMEALVLDRVDSLRCSVSIGVSQASQKHDSLQDWVAEADFAMYRAKTGGRNQVVSV